MNNFTFEWPQTGARITFPAEDHYGAKRMLDQYVHHASGWVSVPKEQEEV